MTHALSRTVDSGGPVAAAPAVRLRVIFRRFWPYVRPDRKWLPISVVLLLFGSATEVVSIWLFKNLVDDVLVPRNFGAFFPLAGVMVGLSLVGAVVSFAGEYSVARIGERFLARLRTETTAHLHTLPPDELDSRWHGDLVARLTSDIFEIEQLVASGVIQAVSACINLMLYSAAAFFLSWPLALAALATAPMFILTARQFGSRIQVRSREARRRDGGVTAVVEETLANANLAHAYNQQRREVERVRSESDSLVRADLATARLGLAYPSLLQVVELIASLVVVGVGAWQLAHGSLSVGGLLAFAAFMVQLFSPVQELAALRTVFGASGAAAERVIELLRHGSPIKERPGARDLTGVRGEVTVLDVSAEYRGREVVSHITLKASPGESVAVMGPSGSGKSTLAKLLVRFKDPSAGAVLVDGTDLRDVTTASVRDTVTLLPQHPRLFRASLRDNIAYGRPDATEEDIVAAAKAADAHGFIQALPHGYDTEVGEEGFQLSGGQLQRIAVARAFLRATPILVLDEPTASLDRQAVDRLVEPLLRLMAGRTTILITHDQDLARQADSVYVLPSRGRAETTPAGGGMAALDGPPRPDTPAGGPLGGPVPGGGFPARGAASRNGEPHDPMPGGPGPGPSWPW